MKMIGRVWRLSLDELRMTAVGMLVAAVFGMVLVAIIVYVDSESYALMGGFLAALLWAVVNVFVIASTFERRLSVAVGMGRTRREFFLCRIAVIALNTALELLLLWGIDLVERGLSSLLYTGLSCEFDMMPYLLKPGMIAGLLLLVPAVGMLLGMLLTRFQRKAFWGIWLLWMLGSLGLPKIMHMVHDNPDSLAVRIMNGIMQTVSTMGVYAGLGAALVCSLVMLAVSYLMLQRQEVRQL